MGASNAFGQPAGAQAILGQAQLQQQGTSLVVTTQNAVGTNRSVINWQSFSVPAGSTTRFDQPSAKSLSINRVVGNDPSAIFGSLSSNGRLVLVNPAGIAVGAGAVVDTAGFTASTLRLSEADALAGRLVFGGDGLGGGALKVDGQILARSGDVVLIAPNVQVGSQALVQAPGGATILAAGQKVELTGRGLEGIRLELQAPADQAVNLGTLQGDAVGIFAGQLKHSGLIQATAVTADGGKVLLRASGDNLVDGQIKATNGDKGGSVDVLGQRVGLMANAAVDASGAAGGGTVRIGGDYQGANPDVQNAQRTYVDPTATILADATQNGNGGKVIVWADDQTQSFGTISARGGAQGGDGGFVEVSGKHRLQFDSKVDTRAPQGKTGTLLLDPDDITIATTGSAYSSPIAFIDTPSSMSLLVNSINGATTNVELQAKNNITFDAPVNMVNTGIALSARAGSMIFVNQPITTKGGAITLTAGDPGGTLGGDGGALYVNAHLDTTGAGTMPLGAPIFLQSQASDTGGASLAIGAININAGTAGEVNISGQGIDIFGASITAGQIYLESYSGATNISGGSTLNSNNQDIYIYAGTESPSGSVGVFISDSTIDAGAGYIEINGSTNYEGTFGVKIERSVDLSAAGGISITGQNLSASVSSGGGGIGIGDCECTTTLTGSGLLTLTGSAPSTQGYGIYFADAQVTRTGAITATGTAPGGQGISLSSANISASSALSISAYGGGLEIIDSSLSSGAAGMTLKADQMKLQGAGGSINAGTGIVTVKTATAARPIDLGITTDDAAALELSASELNLFAGTGVLHIGDPTAGSINISNSIAPQFGGMLSLESGGTITQASSAVLGASKLKLKAADGITLKEANQVSSLSVGAGTMYVSFYDAAYPLELLAVDVANYVDIRSADRLLISGPVSSDGGGVTLQSGPGNSVVVQSSVDSGTGPMLLQSGGLIDVSGATLSTSNAAVSMTAATSVSIASSSITTGSGAVTIQGGSSVILTSISVDSGGLALVGNYINTVDSAIVTANAPVSMVAADGQVSINSTSIVSGNGDITITAGGPALVAHAVMIRDSVLSAGTGDVSLYGETQTGDGVYVDSSSPGLTISGANVSITGKTSLGSSYSAVYVGGQRISGSQSVAISAENGGFYIDTASIVAGAGGLSLSATGGTSYVEIANSTLEIAGNVVLQAAGATINQFGGGITASGLMANGDVVTLSGNNDVQTLSGRAQSGDFKFNNVGTAVPLEIATVDAIGGIQAGGVVEVKTPGLLKLKQLVSSGASGDAITLVANDLSTSGGSLSAPSGRWAVFLQSPTGPTTNLVGSPGSGNSAVWNRTFTGDTAASLPEAGNRYVFAFQPQVTVIVDPATKVYDGTNSFSGLTATVTGIPNASVSGNVFSVEAVSLNPLVSSKNVGSYPIALQSLVQADAYAITYTPVMADITPAVLTASITAADKVYDGSAAAASSFTITGGLIGSETVSASGAATFADKNAGIGKTVTANTVSLADGANGGLASNYTLAVGQTTTADITAATLTISAASDSRVYDGTTVSSLGPLAAGLVGGDTLSASQSFDSKNAGARTLLVNGGYTVNDGNGGNNYVVTTVGNTGSITPATLTISAATETKTYDATTSGFNAPSVSGLMGSDTVIGLGQSFDSQNAGSRILTVNGGYTVNDGNSGNNYTVTTASNTGTITPAPLTVAALNQSKQHGDTFTFTGLEIDVTGLQGGEQVKSAALSSAGAPQDAAYGNYLITAGGSLVGANGFSASNYKVTYQPGVLVVSPVDVLATQQVNNQVVTFLGLFVQEYTEQNEKDKPKGDPDIVLTETCKP
jgi:filamentous hemagglutinin family protein